MRNNRNTENFQNKVPWQEVFQIAQTNTTKKLQQLKKDVNKWDKENSWNKTKSKDVDDIMREYIRVMAQNTEKTRLRAPQRSLAPFEESYNQRRKIYLQFDLSTDERISQSKDKWQFIIEEKAADELNQYMETEKQLMKFFVRMSLFSSGYIPIIADQPCQNKDYLLERRSKDRRFHLDVSFDFVLILCIGIEKIPNFDGSDRLSFFEYIPFIEVVSVLKKMPKEDELKQIFDLYSKNPTKNFKNQLNEDQTTMGRRRTNAQIFNFQKISQSDGYLVSRRVPLIYLRNTRISEEQRWNYFSSLKEYENEKQLFLICKTKQQNSISSYEDEDKKNQREQIKSNFKIQESQDLREAFERGSRYDNKLQLSTQQKKIVTETDNLIVMGRSGTGKTLCFQLKLFSIELSFKLKQIRQNDNSQENTITSMKNLFLTVSDELIKHIKKQYTDLDNAMKNVMNNAENRGNNQQILNLFNNDDALDQINQTTYENLRHFFSSQKKTDYSGFLQEKIYPAFLTIKKFLFILDQDLENPMFPKKQNRTDEQEPEQLNPQSQRIEKILNNNNLIGWNYDQQDEVEENVPTFTRNRSVAVDIENQVTYDFFVKHFWQNLVQVNKLKTDKVSIQKIDPTTLWLQINSVIKGSFSSHLKVQKYLTKEQYLQKKKEKKFREKQPQYYKIIYHLFIMYQNWKTDIKRYDFMDLVNHILWQINRYEYKGELYNYLFIDEVQDLPPAALYLLSKMALNGIFYCGDSAQTIAKGVNFQFKDIKKMFDPKLSFQRVKPLQLQSPKEQMLTLNWRSHNQILQLSHSIIQIIETLFEGSIDTMKQQSSFFRGVLPLVMDGQLKDKENEDRLFQMFVDQSSLALLSQEKRMEFKRNAQGAKYFKLKAEQAIFVRNKQEIDKLPYRLKKQTIFTFEQFKGLEFDDVVLINFFTSMDVKIQSYRLKWDKLLGCLGVGFKQKNQETYKRQLLQRQPEFDVTSHYLYSNPNDHRNIQWKWVENKHNSYERNGQTLYKIPFIKEIKKLDLEQKRQYYEILTQLKILYTAITRARKTFIFYESKITNIPKQLLKLWQGSKNVKIVSEESYEQNRRQLKDYRLSHINLANEEQDKNYKANGFREYRRKNYSIALSYFNKCLDQRFSKRISAEMKANKARQEIKKLQTQLNNSNHLSKNDRKCKQTIIEDKKATIEKNFIEAANLFLQINQFKLAASCFYSANLLGKALEFFEKDENSHLESAVCLQKLAQKKSAECLNKDENFHQECTICTDKLALYKKAGVIYQKSGFYQKMLHCYEKLNDTQLIIRSFVQYSEYFPNKRQESLKYGSIIINEIVKKYSNFSQDTLNLENQKSTLYQFVSLAPEQDGSNIRMRQEKKFQNLLKEERQCWRELDTLYSTQINSYAKLENQLQKIRIDFEKENTSWKFSDVYKLFKIDTKRFDKSDRRQQFTNVCKKLKINMNKGYQIIGNFDKILMTYHEFKQQLSDLDSSIKQKKQEIKVFQKKYKSKWNMNQFINNLLKRQNIFNLKYEADSLKQTQNQNLIQDMQLNQIPELPKTERSNTFTASIFNSRINRARLSEFINKAKRQLQSLIIESEPLPQFNQEVFNPYTYSSIESIILHKLRRKSSKTLKLQNILRFLFNVKKFQGNQLALFICENYEFYHLAQQFILSWIFKMNKSILTDRSVTSIPDTSNDDLLQRKDSDQIDQFLLKLNPKFLNQLHIRTISLRSRQENDQSTSFSEAKFRSTKQKYVNAIVECLFFQGYYRKAMRYLNPHKQQLEIANLFMDLKSYVQILIDTKIIRENQEGQFVVTNSLDFKINGQKFLISSMQHILNLLDSTQKNPFFNQINEKESFNCPNEIVQQIARKVQLKSKQISQGILKKKIQKQEKENYLARGLSLKYVEYRRIQADQLSKLNTSLCANNEEFIKKKAELQQIDKETANWKSQLLKQNVQRGRIQRSIDIKREQQGSLQRRKVELKKFLQQELTPEQKQRNEKDIEQTTSKLNIIGDKIDLQKAKINELDLKIQAISRKILHNARFRQRLTRDNYSLSQVNLKIKQQIYKFSNLQISQSQEENQVLIEIWKLQQQIKRGEDEEQKIVEYLQRKEMQKFEKEEKQKKLAEAKRYFRSSNDRVRKLFGKTDHRYFSLFLKEGYAIKLHELTGKQRKPLINTIKNSEERFEQLSDFQLCELLMLYLSSILHSSHQKLSFFTNLGQQASQMVNELQEQMKLCSQENDLMEKQLDKYQGIDLRHSKRLQRQRQQKEYQILRNQLASLDYLLSRCQIDQAFKQRLTPGYRLVTLFIKIFQQFCLRKNNKLVELLMGFFQCKMITNEKTLWFLNKDYVILKSSSIIVKKLVEKRKKQSSISKLFLFYFDPNQQYTIATFIDAHQVIKSLLYQQHMKFLTVNSLYGDINWLNQVAIKTIPVGIYQARQDEEGMKLQIFCDPYHAVQISKSYQMYENYTVEFSIQKHKRQVLDLYYSNSIQSSEVFHFIYYHLKKLQEVKELILTQNKSFSNAIIKKALDDLSCLQKEFNVWKSKALEKKYIIEPTTQ